MIMGNKVFVSIYYSNDCESPLYQFDTKEEAIEFIKKNYEEELRISEKEGNDDVSYSYFNDCNGNARISYNNESEDFIEWNIASLKK